MKTLIVKDLSFSYKDKEIFKNLNFIVEKGDFIAVLGKSGAGKSTLLKCFNLLNKPNGEILVNNDNIITYKKKQLTDYRKKVSFIFQDYNVLDNLYTIDNVLTPYLANKSFFQQFLDYSKNEYERGLKYLNEVGLEEESFKKTKYLSGGQKQRVAIARALCQNPELILADEPVSSLDENNSILIMDILKNMNTLGKTIVINLHDVELAKKYSNKILALKDGKILFYKDTERVTNDEFKQIYN